MKHFLILANGQKDVNLKVTHEIQTYLQERGVKCFVEVKANREEKSDPFPDDIDCGLVLGGDGTLLQAAHDTLDMGIPLIGVNLGTMGYLAEVEKGNITQALNHLIQDEFKIEERMMLCGKVTVAGRELDTLQALNDIVIAGTSSLQMIDFDIYVNGQYLYGYSADGILVATPTGSTGYNLSAGGPIVEPKAKILLLTPICPHTLHSRSILLAPEDEILVRIADGRDGQCQKVEANFDGNRKIELTTGDSICIKKSEKVTKIMKINEVSFLEVLHKKMNTT